MFSDKKKLRAMLAADERHQGDVDGGEVAAFRHLSQQIKAAEAVKPPSPPDFDLAWAGIEARIAAQEKEGAELLAAAGQKSSWFRTFIVAAPVGALIVAAVLGYFVVGSSSSLGDNRCYVDSYDASSGTILIQQDLDDRHSATVIWHLEEG